MRSTKPGMPCRVAAIKPSSLCAGTTTATLFPSSMGPMVRRASARRCGDCGRRRRSRRSRRGSARSARRRAASCGANAPTPSRHGAGTMIFALSTCVANASCCCSVSCCAIRLPSRASALSSWLTITSWSSGFRFFAAFVARRQHREPAVDRVELRVDALQRRAKGADLDADVGGGRLRDDDVGERIRRGCDVHRLRAGDRERDQRRRPRRAGAGRRPDLRRPRRDRGAPPAACRRGSPPAPGPLPS